MELKEKCGIVGVYGEGLEAARLVHSGLWSLQHRGQESSGIASSEGRGVRVHKGEGLVAHVYDEEHLQLLAGHIAVGHNRYSTSGGSVPAHFQPVTDEDCRLALAHNGNLPVTVKLKKFLTAKKIDFVGCNDSELMFLAIKYYLKEEGLLQRAVKAAYPLFTGAFCLLVMTRDQMVAVRDSSGIRPLCIGKLDGGWVFASETCALDTISATYVREVEPGEMVLVDKGGLEAHKLAKGVEKLDIFEFVYFARPDSKLLGRRVNEVRKEFGRILAKEHPIEADVVVPVPDSAIPAALGYAQATGIRFEHGLIKNRYIHRTFIRPAQKLRERDVTMKLNPLPEVFNRKRVIVIDDSLVRGTTSKKIVDMLRKAGAKEVHMLISSPPVKYPDFYGIDTPHKADLVAGHMKIEEIRKMIGADSLGYLSYQGLIRATGLPESRFCTACFTGRYPISIGKQR